MYFEGGGFNLMPSEGLKIIPCHAVNGLDRSLSRHRKQESVSSLIRLNVVWSWLEVCTRKRRWSGTINGKNNKVRSSFSADDVNQNGINSRNANICISLAGQRKSPASGFCCIVRQNIGHYGCDARRIIIWLWLLKRLKLWPIEKWKFMLCNNINRAHKNFRNLKTSVRSQKNAQKNVYGLWGWW